MIIMLDMDDVLVDWTSVACKEFNVNLDNPDVRCKIEGCWGAIDEWVTEEELWNKIHGHGPNWWANLPLLPWANKLYAEAKKFGEVCILTAPSDDPSCLAGKVMSIKKHFNTRDFLIGRPKHMVADRGKVLIDDRPDNCSKFVKYGGHAFLWPNALKLLRLNLGEKAIDEAVYFLSVIKQVRRLKIDLPFCSTYIPEADEKI